MKNAVNHGFVLPPGNTEFDEINDETQLFERWNSDEQQGAGLGSDIADNYKNEQQVISPATVLNS